jgi:Domain of unknown function (DUF4055)
MMASKNNIHTDPNLPSYQSLAYRSSVEKWQLAQKVYDGPDLDCPSGFSQYLPQECREPDRAYTERVKTSILLWESKFRQAVNNFASLLSKLKTESLPQSLTDRLTDIDDMGTDLGAFVERMAIGAGVSGGAFVLVDYEQGVELDSALEEIGSARSPYLVQYDPSDVLNIREVEGVLKKVTIEQRSIEPEGEYGESERTLYRVLTPGLSELFEIVTQKDGSCQSILIQSQLVTDRQGRPLTEIPLVYFAPTPGGMRYYRPSDLLTMAKLNLHLWHVESDRWNVMHKCNQPTPVIEDDEDKFDSQGNPVDRVLTLGPNSFVSVSKGGSAYFMEPSGAALAATKGRIDDIKAEIAQMSIDFISGQSAFTATQSNLQATSTNADVQGMALQLNSALSEIKRIWCLYTLEADTGTIVVSDKLTQPPIPIN